MRRKITLLPLLFVACAHSPQAARFTNAEEGGRVLWEFPASRSFVVDLVGQQNTDQCLQLLDAGAPECTVAAGGVDVVVRKDRVSFLVLPDQLARIAGPGWLVPGQADPVPFEAPLGR